MTSASDTMKEIIKSNPKPKKTLTPELLDEIAKRQGVKRRICK